MFPFQRYERLQYYRSMDTKNFNENFIDVKLLLCNARPVSDYAKLWWIVSENLQFGLWDKGPLGDMLKAPHACCIGARPPMTTKQCSLLVGFWLVVILCLFVVICFSLCRSMSLCSCCVSLCSRLIDLPVTKVNSHFRVRLWSSGPLMPWASEPVLIWPAQ